MIAAALAQPRLLVFTDLAPKIQHNDQPYDPNVDLQPYLTPFLEELRKVQVEWYRPTHPIAQQFAQRRDLSEEQLRNPTPALRAQLARAWDANYIMTVRCTRPPEKAQYDYTITVWELGKRAPVWETDGFQQSGGDETAALRTLGRTVAIRLDSELWSALPRVAEPLRTPTPSPTPRDAPLPADPKPLAEQLLREGKYQEALLPLRILVNAEPDNADLRLQLIRLYRRLNMTAHAKAELERAASLLTDAEMLALEWTALLQAEGNLDEAQTRLQTALDARPDSQVLRLALVDLHLQRGDAQSANHTLQPIASLNTDEVLFRRYLIAGATRSLDGATFPPVSLTESRAALWLQIVGGLLADLASELLDIRRLANSPNPNGAALRTRSERAVLTALNISKWLDAAQPDAAVRTLVAHARFASQMLAQSAQHMARYVLSRKPEEEERASLLRIEAMRELEAARNALPKREL
ncbi:MAG: tetratricopeptide repeat protein [Fimbriimonadales bacterium]|nr:tetratricopeptide repeat protein [Fimbriimonadales bacterium]